MLTDVFIVNLPDDLNNSGSRRQRPQHGTGVIHCLLDHRIFFFYGLPELHRQNNGRFKWSFLADTAHLFIEASIDFIIFMPADEAPRTTTVAASEPVLDLRNVLHELPGPRVVVAAA
jgi:hypothetical protein